MKKLFKTLSIICIFALVASAFMLFSTTAFAYDSTIQISNFVDGDPLPDGDHLYVNDLPYTVYLYTDSSWSDLYFCVNNQPPFDYAQLDGVYEPGASRGWSTYNNSFGEHPIMRLFLCYHTVMFPIDEKAATCTEDGIIAHYQCYNCGWLFNDEECQSRIYHEADTVDPAGHSVKAVKAKDATCTEDGIIAHYQCDACGKLFSDEEATTELTKKDVVVPATGHVSKVVPGKAATYDATGLTDGEICEKCGTVLVEQEEIPKLEKEPDNKKEKPENKDPKPEKKDPEPEKKSPETSDANALYICLAIALISLTSASVALKRKHDM